MIRALTLLLLVLCGCTAREQLKEGKPVVSKPAEKKEVSLSAMANFCAGYYAMAGQEWKLAAEFYERALEGNPKSQRILRYLIACYVQLNEEDKALSYMATLSDINREDFTIHYTLANIHESEGRIDEAITEYERAARSNIKQIDMPLLVNTLYHLAHLYFANNEPAKAVTCLKDIIKLAPPIDLSSFYAEMGMAYIESEEYDKAREALETSKKLNPDLPQTRLYLAIAYDETGQLDTAIVEANNFLQAFPDAWLAHAFLSGLYAKAEDTEQSDLHRKKAIALLQVRVAQGTSNIREDITLARLLVAENEKNAALRVVELAANKSKTDKESTEVHFFLANLYYEANRPEQVERELREVLSINPNSHEASNFLGYFYAERGEDLDEALGLIESALETEPENGAYLDSLGWVYYKQATESDNDERMDLAMEKLMEAVKASPDPEIYKHIGIIYYGLGRWEMARKQWETALEEFQDYEDDPNMTWIKKQLERLDALQPPESELYQEQTITQ